MGAATWCVAVAGEAQRQRGGDAGESHLSSSPGKGKGREGALLHDPSCGYACRCQHYLTPGQVGGYDLVWLDGPVGDGLSAAPNLGSHHEVNTALGSNSRILVRSTPGRHVFHGSSGSCGVGLYTGPHSALILPPVLTGTHHR